MSDHNVSNTIANKTPSIKKLNVPQVLNEYSMSDLKRLVEIRYEHYSEFGRKMCWTNVTVSALLNGHWIPSDPTLIQRIADELQINVIKLTQLFARTEEREKGE